jgi:hypothetical protein
MISYIPVLTTLLSVFFLSRIVLHYRSKKSPYLLWWTLGVLTFGMGALTESINAIFGWTEGNAKVWYIVGALLGGYPLAQGTIYLLMKKRFADVSAVVCSAFILIAAVCVLSSPVEIPQGFDYRLTGRVFAWQWVRAFSPLLNLYAFVFLFGGAVYSAIQYFANDSGRARFVGNVLIAIGALLPGIGGSFTRFGYVEVLYITELIGLTVIYFGYRINESSAWELKLRENRTSLVGNIVRAFSLTSLAIAFLAFVLGCLMFLMFPNEANALSWLLFGCAALNCLDARLRSHRLSNGRYGDTDYELRELVAPLVARIRRGSDPTDPDRIFPDRSSEQTAPVADGVLVGR